VFWGSYDHVLDEKGRTSLPKEYRDLLGDLESGAWLTAYPSCLILITAAEFETQRARMLNPVADTDSVQRLQRMFIGMATPCVFDKAGRILIPPKLRKWAALERDIVFTGCGERIEIWDRSRHEIDMEQTRQNYPQYKRDLQELTR